jgi:hypothetical protein
MKDVFIIFVLISVFFIGCNCTKNDTPQLMPSNVTVSETLLPEKRNVVIKEEGWEIPGLKNSKVIKSNKLKSNNLLTTKAYALNKRTVIEPTFFTDNEREILRVFKGELVIYQLWGFEFEGRNYCYSLLVHPPGIGANIPLRFFDSDGDGKFESVEGGDSKLISTPYTPNWVK